MPIKAESNTLVLLDELNNQHLIEAHLMPMMASYVATNIQCGFYTEMETIIKTSQYTIIDELKTYLAKWTQAINIKIDTDDEVNDFIMNIDQIHMLQIMMSDGNREIYWDNLSQDLKRLKQGNYHINQFHNPYIQKYLRNCRTLESMITKAYQSQHQS